MYFRFPHGLFIRAFKVKDSTIDPNVHFEFSHGLVIRDLEDPIIGADIDISILLVV